MRTFFTLCVGILCAHFSLSAQTVVLDTLAFQDFEVSPASPTWTYTGTPYGFQSGTSGSNATPANSPIGIGGSRAWHVESQSSGNPLIFDNQLIPSGTYDSIIVRFRLAAFNLSGTSGGPDHLDYVLVSWSDNGGTTFNDRIRVRGSSANNSSWGYNGTAIAKEYYLPATEVIYQPTTSGLQTTFGYSTVELTFPGSLSQLALRITPRSSSSTDDWLIDNLVLIGQKTCSPSTGSLTLTECDFFTAPSGTMYSQSGIFQDTIQNASGCDSIITIDLTINQSSSDTLVLDACDSYTAPSGAVYTMSGVYLDTISNAVQCDSVLTIDLTVNSSSLDTLTETACGSYIAPSGAMYTTSGMIMDTVQASTGCDSVFQIDLTVNTVDTSVTESAGTLSAQASGGAVFQWLDCDNGFAVIPGETNASFTPAQSGNYAVAVTQNGCVDTSACRSVTVTGLQEDFVNGMIKVWPNPATNLLHLELPSADYAGVVRIIDLQGSLLMEERFFGKSHLLSLEQISAGMYVFELEVDGVKQHMRFVKK